jgi:hypothetical protein
MQSKRIDRGLYKVIDQHGREWHVEKRPDLDNYWQYNCLEERYTWMADVWPTKKQCIEKIEAFRGYADIDHTIGFTGKGRLLTASRKRCGR